MFFEIGATVLGLIQGVLVMFNKRSNWIFYVLQMIFLIVFSSINRIYGDIINNSIYLVMGIIGFILWNKKKDEDVISKSSFGERIVYLLIIILGTFIIYNFLKNTDDPVPMLDAFTTISSLVATYYMMKRKIDTWVIWFFNDIFYSLEYFMLPNQAFYLFLLNVIWTFMAICSYYSWFKIMKGEK